MPKWNKAIPENRVKGLFLLGQITLVSVFAGFLIFEIMNAPAPDPPPSFYFQVRAAILGKPQAQRLAGLVSPFDLKLQRVDQFVTNAFGWLMLTNGAGAASTQWFCGTFDSRVGKNVTLIKIKFYNANPQRDGENSAETSSSPGPNSSK